jgi:hypothetical protein
MTKCLATVESEDRVYSIYEVHPEYVGELPDLSDEKDKRIAVYANIKHRTVWYGAYVLMPLDKSAADVEADLTQFMDGDESAVSYLDAQALARLRTGGGSYPRYGSWRPTPVDRRGACVDDYKHSWVMVAMKTRDSDVLGRETFIGLHDAAVEANDGEGVEVLGFNHWGCGWFETLLVEPCSSAHDAVKPYLDAWDIDEAERMAQITHLANVFELQCHALYVMENMMIEPDAKVTGDMTRAAVQLFLSLDEPDAMHERYEIIFEDMCEELGLELD